MQNILQNTDPVLVASAIAGLVLFALIYVSSQTLTERKAKSNIRKRLTNTGTTEKHSPVKTGARATENSKKLSREVAQKANDFYAISDPENLKRIRMQLMQAGFMQPNAVGYFIASRFAAGIGSALVGLVVVFMFYAEQTLTYKASVLIFLAAAGYFVPNFYLSRRIKKIEIQNRQGFPDILDLMVVSAEAGLTMEASIERIASEIKKTYPHLSSQLNMASLEIRAGRPIDQALRAFGDRLRLDEVKGFATMVQQAKELGTSVSDALRVYSEEMRHKRMMAAEEKAYALPAKMSVPVTVFILPIVIGIAIVPTIVRFNI